MPSNNKAYEIADAVADRLSFVELVERLARLRRYLRQEEELGERPHRDVIRVFLGGVEGLLRSLDPYADLLASRQPLDAYERMSFARRVTTLFSLFVELHAQLSHLRGTWARPESQLFIENVRHLLAAGRLPEGIPVVLHNEYSFEQDDLASGLKSLFLGNGVSLQLPLERPTVFLPKAEHENPLYWANLAHECGHIDRTGIEQLISDPTLFPAQATELERATLKRWAEELYCDLFALKVLGPAYLVAFLAFTLLESDLFAGEYGSSTHPPDIVRICMMQRVLENRGLHIPLQGELADFRDIARLYYFACESRSRTLRRQYQKQGESGFLSACVPPQHYAEMSGPILTQCVDNIIDRIDQAVQNEHELKSEDFARIERLAGRLADGILIGSYPDEIAVAKCLAEIWTNSEPPEAGSANYQGDVKPSKEAFERLKGVIQEVRTTPWEIINAGWLHKIQVIHSEAFGVFFAGDGSLLKKIDQFDDRLRASDDVLLKSIEVAQIHKAFERRKQ